MSEESTVTHHHHESNQNQSPSYEPPSFEQQPPSQFPNTIEESRVIHHHHESNQSSPPQFPNKDEDSGVIRHHQHQHHREPPYQPPYESPAPPPPVVPHYGTFQGIPSSPSIGFPQPSPPHQYYAHGYQAVPGYMIAEGTPVDAYHHRLPCCGIGYGWFLFIIGFFLAGVPWYAAAIIFLCCGRVDPREKPAYICCMIAAVLGIITTIFGVMSLDD